MIEGVYINLGRSGDRRESMERQCEAFDLPYPIRRFEAIDGSTRRDCPAGLRPPQYGCWLSHLQALERHPGNAHLHIMEDDALLSSALPALPDLIQAMEAGSGEDWDVLYLDATLVEVPDMNRMYEWTHAARARGVVQVHRIPREFTVYGMHSYVVNGRRRQHVVDHLKRLLPFQKPIDNAMAHGIQRGDLQAFVSTPFVTSGADLGLSRTVGPSGGEEYVAWLMFRRLCFWEFPDEALAQMEQRLPALLRDTDRAAAVLGALMAYRTARWPQQRFLPGIET